MNTFNSIKACLCCGSEKISINPVLWSSLIDEWRLSRYEVDYIDRQQGLCCTDCGSNLRSMTLGLAIMRCYGYCGLFKDFVKQKVVKDLQILEINEAGNLTKFLSQIQGHTIKSYPDIDIMSLSFSNMTFDLVVHSDVLEHIQYPVRGLSECRRVLKPNGYCAFTVPIVVDRLTISREGMPPSYHGSADDITSDFQVYSEYGSDAWKHVIQAGFQECRIFSVEYPSSQALVAVI